MTRAAAVLAVGICVHVVLGTVAFIRAPRPAGDFDRYYEIATGRGWPYVDYQVEHPLGTLAIFKLLTVVGGNRAAFGRSIVALNFAANAVIVIALLRTWGVNAAAFYIAVSAPLAGLLFNRVDFWSMAAATAAVAAWRRNRLGRAGASLAIGASLKLWPLVFAPMLMVSRRLPRAAIIVCSGTAAIVVAAAITASGRAAAKEVLTFRSAHGWQIESIVGSVTHLVSVEGPRDENGSWRTGTMSSATSVALFAVAAPVCLWLVWCGIVAGELGAVWLASVSWLLVFSALLSAQYIGWLMPGAAIAFAEHRRRLASMMLSASLLTLAFWTIFSSVIERTPLAMLLLLTRNAVLIVLAVDATATVARGRLRLQPELETNLTAVRVVKGAEHG